MFFLSKVFFKTMAKINPIGSGKPDISAVDAAIVTFTKEIQAIKNELGTQRSESRNVIIGVMMASLLIVVAVAVEVILSNRNDANFYSRLENNIYNQNIKVNDLNNRVDNIMVRNSYLK
jgi:hypothetical protein